MKKQILMLLAGVSLAFGANAQTLYVPSGTSGIGNSSVSGNVGVGISNPSQKLEVSGNIRLTGSYNALYFASTNQFITANETYKTLVLGANNAEKFHINGTETKSLQPFRVAGFNSLVFGNNGRQQFIYGNDTYKTLVLGADSTDKLYINKNGVGVGTNPFSGYQLSVNGKIISTGLKIQAYAYWADYVFKKDYKLKSLEEVEAYIAKESHLPDVPSAKEIADNGFETADMLKIQMQKIEELTLYIIDLKKEVEALKK